MRAQRKRYPKGTWMRLTSGALLRELMNAKGLSNEDVARHVGCQRTFISALVNERRTSCKPTTADRIAERLEVPTRVLFVERVTTVGGQKDAAA